MEIYQIKVFLEVARHLSFTDAADALNLTQPAVSAKIKSLESELGTPLFYRVGRKVELTEVGQFLLEQGPALIELENQLLQTIQAIKKGSVGTLKIGCTSAIAEGWIPDMLFNYRQQYPQMQTRCVVFESVEFLYRAITSNQVDLGISDVGFAGISEISTTPLRSVRYSLLVAASHRLAAQSWLSLKELTNYPWVVLPTGTPSRLVLESRLQELGLSLNDFPQLETVDTISLMRTYVMQGGYLGFASEFELKPDCQAKTVVSVSLQEFALPGTVYLLMPKRLEACNGSGLGVGKTRSPSLNPVQQLATFLQSATDEVSDSLSSPRLRSPGFSLYRSTPRTPETLTLTIGVQNLTIPAISAGLLIERLGLLEHFLPTEGRYSGIEYQIHWRNFTTGAPIVEGLRSGNLNIGVLGDYPLLLSGLQAGQPSDQQTRLVSFVSTNPDGSCNAVVVPHHSNLESIEDLRGRVVAVPFHSSAHSMMLRSLQATNLLSEVELAALDYPSSAEAFKFPRPLADGYAHFAPFHEVACRQGKFRYLTSDRVENLPVFYGVVVQADLADHYPEVVIAYLKALTAAQSWYNQTPASLPLVSRWTQVETDIVAQILHTTYQHNQTGRFFLETTIRPDWLNLHINQLSQIPGNELVKTLDLNRWVQPEFLQRVTP